MTNTELQIKCAQDLPHDTTNVSPKHNTNKGSLEGDETSPEEDIIIII